MTLLPVPSDASASTLAAGARGVVFDKDGTLFDLDTRWLPWFETFVGGVAAGCGDPSLAPVIAAALGVERDGLLADRPAAIDTATNIRDLVVAVLVSGGRAAAAARRLVIEAENAASPGPLVPLGDLRSTLWRLAKGGRRIGIATADGRGNSIAELEQFDVLHLVDTLRCGDDDGPVKPDPTVLWGIADEWGLTPAQLLYVGDNRHDLATARSAGVPFVAVTRPGSTPWPDDPGDAQVHRIDQLVD